MTKAQILSSAADTLEDPNNVHFTTTDLNDSLLDGYQIIALMSQCIEKVATVNFVGQKNFYNLSQEISDFYRVWAIYNNNTKRWLYPNVLDSFKSYHLRWQSQHGEPREFAPLGFSHIAIYPKLAASTGSMLVFYKAWPTEVSDSTQFEFPAALHSALEDYVVGDMNLQDLEFSKFGTNMGLFMEKLLKIEKFVNNRALPDRIYSLTCPSSQTLISSD